MPTVTFNTIADLIAYVNQYIRVNHNNEITGEQHNNVENGLATFIISSPRNYNRANVETSAAAFVAVASQCILVFKSGATGSIQLVDNKWNEWVIYNNSGANKQLVGTITSYKTNAGLIKNYVSSGAVLYLAKGNDNVWYEVDNGTGGGIGSNTNFDEVEFEIGTGGSPMAAGDTVLTITVNNPQDKSDIVFLDGSFLYKDRVDRISYAIVYSSTQIEITFNQGVQSGQLYSVKYAYKT